MWARTAWGSVFTFDPLAFFSFVAWVIYAGTLAGRAVAGLARPARGVLRVFGFAALVLTLERRASSCPGRHGS